MTETATASTIATTVPSPAGPLAVVLTPEGVVLAAGFAPLEAIVARVPGLVVGASDPRVVATAALAELGPGTAGVLEAAARYADGELAALDAVVVDQPGGPFQQRAWQAMRDVPAGRTVTYSQLAAAAGNPGAVRAAGSACARNRVAPFVPCHRILRIGGALGGYYYGTEVKRTLLEHEGASPVLV